jgi:OmpA-OmpF porin, OOP family
MAELIIGLSALSLMSSAAYAQQPVERMSTTETETCLVFFDLAQATLIPQSAEVVAKAADENKSTGAARVAVSGNTDLSGSPSHNLALSQRRAETVERELAAWKVQAWVVNS